MQSAPVIYWSAGPQPALDGFQIIPGVYAVGAARTSIASTRSVIGSHGTGVLRGRLISDLESASVAHSELRNIPLKRLGQEMRGSLTIYVYDSPNKSVSILPDPLGGGLVFRHEDNDGVAVSSDLAALVSFLKLIQKNPKKSLEYVASLVATGSGGLVDSSYEDISVLPQFTYMEFTQDAARTLEYPAKEGFFHSRESYEDSIEIARMEILANVEALSQAVAKRKVAHLTGGIDSRMVLSAILALGEKDAYSYFCSGGTNEPDQVVAQKVALEYGLTMTENSGVDSAFIPETLEEQLLWGFQHTAGINSGVTHKGNVNSGTIILGGGYGELFRSFYNRGESSEKDIDDLAEHMFGSLAFSQDLGKRLLSDQSVGIAKVRLQAAIDEADVNGVRKDARLDYVYMARRNRYFIGEIARGHASSGARVDPLYSLAGASLGLRVDAARRHANVIGFDLMESMAPGLSSYPFDYDRFNEAFLDLRGQPKRRHFAQEGKPTYDRAIKLVPSNVDRVDGFKPSQADKDRALKLNMQTRLATQFPAVRDGLREIVASIPSDQFDGAFSRTALAKLISREPTHRAYYRTARDLYAGLLWYAKG